MDELRAALERWDSRPHEPDDYADSLAAACRGLLARIDARMEQAGEATIWLPLADARDAARAARIADDYHRALASTLPAERARHSTLAAEFAGLAARIEARMITGAGP